MRPSIKFLVTSTCNIACRFCHNEFQGDGSASSSRTFDETMLRTLLTSLSNSQEFGTLKISGGEPFTAWKNVETVLESTRELNFQKKVCVTNLLAGDVRKYQALFAANVREFRVNVPAFTGADYAEITGTSPRSYATLLRKGEQAKSYGFRIRANVVVQDSTIDIIENALFLNQVDPIFDEVFCIIDYGSVDRTLLEHRLIRLLCEQGERIAERKARITEFTLHKRKISLAHCTIASNAIEAPADQDIYIRPPGLVMRSFVRGFAFR